MKELQVEKVIQISDDIFELFLVRDDFKFEVGNCVGLYGLDNVTSRAYSIASGVNDEYLSFIIKKIPDGLVSPYLCNLKHGDKVKLSNPYGWFKPSSEKKSVFISTGTGISPFMSAMRSGCNPPITFYMGSAYYKDLQPYHNFLINRVNLIVCLTRDFRTDEFFQGRVTKHLEMDITRGIYDKDTHFYICGSNALIEDCSYLLTCSDVEAEYIHHECFFNSEE